MKYKFLLLTIFFPFRLSVSLPFKMAGSYFLAVGVAIIMLSGCAGTRQITNNDTMDLYLLVGQSNMAGRGTPDAASKEVNPQILMLEKAGNWVPATDPMHFDKPEAIGVGPGLSFAQEMLKQNPKRKIGLIPCAVGGSPIKVWEKGVYYDATKVYPYDDAIRRAKLAQQSGTLKGIIWHQGESDSSPEGAKIYLQKLTAVISNFRTDLGAPNVPFVAGELGYYRDNYKLINTELKKLPQLVPNTAVATAEDLVHKGDNTHFDTPSTRILGKRLAAAFIRLQKSGK